MESGKRQALKEKRKAEKRRNQMKWLGITVGVALVLVIALIFAGQVRTPSVEHVYSNKDGIQLGNPEAPVHIVEFGDFQCIHCRNFHGTTGLQLITDNVETGEVFFEYRVVDFLGPESSLSAEAAFCAADQNVFWEYHDVVFANYSSGNTGGYSEDKLVEFASVLDMDVDSFSSCLESGEMSSEVIANRELASASGVTGTPSFIVNGQRYGNMSYAGFQELIASLTVAN